MLLQKINNRVSGFTILELMIVVAIIGIAVAIGGPLVVLMMEDNTTEPPELTPKDPSSDPNEADPAEEETKGDMNKL